MTQLATVGGHPSPVVFGEKRCLLNNKFYTR